MYPVVLTWKEFNISLPDVEAWMKVNVGEYYVGNSADSKLTLWFSQDPGETVLSEVQTYWDGLTEESAEVVNYVSLQDIQDTIAGLKAGIPGKAWNDMSVAEQKIVLGLTPTKIELGL